MARRFCWEGMEVTALCRKLDVAGGEAVVEDGLGVLQNVYGAGRLVRWW
jgi:hypothetical protein